MSHTVYKFTIGSRKSPSIKVILSVIKMICNETISDTENFGLFVMNRNFHNGLCRYGVYNIRKKTKGSSFLKAIRFTPPFQFINIIKCKLCDGCQLTYSLWSKCFFFIVLLKFKEQKKKIDMSRLTHSNEASVKFVRIEFGSSYQKSNFSLNRRNLNVQIVSYKKKIENKKT